MDRFNTMDSNQLHRALDGEENYVHISAAELRISWGDNPSYWEMVPDRSSIMFPKKIARLKSVCWFDVKGEIVCSLPRGAYTVSWRAYLSAKSRGWGSEPVHFTFSKNETEVISECKCYIKRPMYGVPDLPTQVDQFSLPTIRAVENGWTEYDVGEFVIEEGEGNCALKFAMLAIGGVWKSGLSLDGVFIRSKRLMDAVPAQLGSGTNQVPDAGPSNSVIVADMGSHRGDDGETQVSLESGQNQESEPPNFSSLCEFCQGMVFGFQFVGFGPSFDPGGGFGFRPIGEILEESRFCLFCGEIAEFYNEWSREIFGYKAPFLTNHRALFQLHQETGVPISPDPIPEPDLHMPNINRIRVHFEVPNRRSNSGKICPVLQFQKCSQPPLQVSNGGSLSDWENAEEQPYNGRIRPLVADTRLFRKWKDTCGDTHGDRCNSILTGSRLPRLRLIDVDNMCVVDSENYTSYVTLSYVWGELKRDQIPMLTTKHLFREPGSLSEVKLPTTIGDAIEVTRKLGEKYIWVDCLCIMQDDEADKGYFFPQMDSIFGSASVTIVAASGRNADAGLPGIKPNSRFREQKPFTINLAKRWTVTLVRTLDPEGSRNEIRDPYYYLEDSVWCTRGWILQEKIFSRRALIFTKEQVYWECQTASWCEDGFWEAKKSRTVYRPCLSTDFRRPWHSDADSFEAVYKKLISEYSQRTLTYESDGLDAFKGILNALKREACQDFLWALPKSLLSSRSLMWYCYKQSNERREELCPVRHSNSTTILCPFPSWSWVGWLGAVKSLLMFSSSDLVFYYLDGKRQMQRVDEAQIHSVLFWEEGCIVQGLSWGTGRTDITLEEISVLSQSIASNLLFFWTSLANLQMRNTGRTDYGYDNIILSHNDKYVECTWYQTPVSVPGHMETADFVTIGGDCRSTLAILLVEWKDGVAYRWGLATILGSHWVELDNREWKMICLG